MKRTRLLSTTALGLALLAAPALAQRQGTGGEAPTTQERATAAVDRMHKGNGTNGGPAELLRMAQSSMRNGRTAEANELLERAETRLLLRATGGDSARPAQGEPAHHVAEARRALTGRDRAEAMRHTNLAIATTRDDGGSAAGGDAARQGAEGGGMGGRSGAVDSGMGTPGRGSAVVRDGGTAGVSVSRAEGVVLAQQSGSGGTRGAPTGLPPGDIPGWSGPRSGAAPAPRGGTTAPLGGTPQGTLQGTAPQGLIADPALGGNSRGNALTSGSPNTSSGPSSSSMTGGEPARVGGAPPSDTTRSPGSSGISGAGVGNSGVGGPIR